eukprot:1975542-Pleurochrysis_carterae.AAC.1
MSSVTAVQPGVCACCVLCVSVGFSANFAQIPTSYCDWHNGAGAVPFGFAACLACRFLSKAENLRQNRKCGRKTLSRFSAQTFGSSCVQVNVVIPTGRAHQIRIHTAYAGHPLVGDPLYAVGGLPYAVWQGSGGAGAGPEAGAGTTADADAVREVKVGGSSAGNGSGDCCGAGANVAASGCGGNGGGGGDDDAAGSGACGGGDGGDHAGGSGVSRGSGGAAPSPHWDGYGEGNVRSVAAPAPSGAKTTSRPPLPRDGG